jgi:SAM-dependent methyltransferase
MFMNSPISPARLDRLIRELCISPGHRVLDVGCGSGELLLRVAEAHRCSGLGIDLNEGKIAEAHEAAGRRLAPHANVEFRVQNAAEFSAPSSYDRGLCLGATFAFCMGPSAYERALTGLKGLVTPGGLILVGEPYWKQPPAQKYLELLGDPVGTYRDHTENVLFAEKLGLTPLYAATSSDEEWDDFEWAHRRRFEDRASSNPTSTEALGELESSRRWRDGYLRWGRDTLGFGFYIFRN